MYKARHVKRARHRVTLPMLVIIAALCVAILFFPTTASGVATTPDAVSGGRSIFAQLSSGRDTYSIFPCAQHDGSVQVSSSSAAAGKTVTFTVTADSGFETASVAAITSGGSTLEVKRVKDETYSFVMPAQGVVIDVCFQCKRA